MGYNLCRKSADMGRSGKLIQIAGNAFQLRHKIEVFAPHPLTDSPAPDKLPDNLGRLTARFPDKSLQLKMMLAVEPCADDILLLAAFADCRTAALIKLMFHRFDFND